MSSGLFKNVTYKLFAYVNSGLSIKKRKKKRLMCYKTQPNQMLFSPSWWVFLKFWNIC